MRMPDLDTRVADPLAEDGSDARLGGYAEQQVSSPFAAAVLLPPSGGADAPSPPAARTLHTPFAEAMTAGDEGALVAEATEALLAEIEDEEFAEAVEALVNEAAGRHLGSTGTWSQASEAPVLAASDAERWMESVAEQADRVLGALEARFGDRPVESLRDGELDAVPEMPEMPEVSDPGGSAGVGVAGPIGAQEQFLKSLIGKAKHVISGVAKVAKAGLAVAGNLLPIGRLIRIMRDIVPLLLREVLRRAIGRLPAQLRPLAMRLAGRFVKGAGASAGAESAPEDTLAEVFDRQVAEIVVAPNPAVVVERLVAAAESESDMGDGHSGTGSGSMHALDVARARLARELADAVPGQPPTAQMEQFVPVVMAAAVPVIRAVVRLVGKERVVKLFAAPLAKLIEATVGAEGAKLLSRHIASAGLQLLGLEAEDGIAPSLATAPLGTEALVAAAEDTIREVLALPVESLRDELLVETEIQEAFAAAAARHLPAAVLRPELVEGESVGEHAVWVMMPRATRPCFRYKKYSRIVPVVITRPAARSVTMPDGDTLEQRLLEAGVRSWPVDGEVEIYELLAGAELGHLAAFESTETTDVDAATREFEELGEAAAALLAGNPRLAANGRRGQPGGHPHAGRRYYRLRVGGMALPRRRLFALRLDLTSPRPVLRVHLLVGEHGAHALAAHLEQRRMVQALSVIRGLAGPAMRQAMGRHLERMLGKRGVALAPGAAQGLAEQLADAMIRTVSGQLPAAAATLAQAARNPAAGVTLSFGFTFPDKAGLGTAAPGDSALTIRPGHHRD